jgi:hypothetical protein
MLLAVFHVQWNFLRRINRFTAGRCDLLEARVEGWEQLVTLALRS